MIYLPLMRGYISSSGHILRGYRVVFVCCIVALSVLTIERNVDLHSPAEHPHAAVLGGMEAFTALLFLFRRTQLAGVVGLVAVFATAAVISVASGQLPFHLVLYAASAVVIVLLDRALLREQSVQRLRTSDE